MSDGKIREATTKQMLDYNLILTNERGDELWRYCDGADNRPRWKVWAVEPTDRRTIRDWQGVEISASYFQTGKHVRGGSQFIGSDFIIPYRLLFRTTKFLGLNLKRIPSKPLTERQKANLAKYRFQKKARAI